MDRRSFFKSMVGGVAAAAAVRTFPFRVFSFPSEIKVAQALPITSMRFVRMFDPMQMRMINRFDVLYGFGPALECPKAVEEAEQWKAKNGEFYTEKDVENFKKRAIEKCIPVGRACLPFAVPEKEFAPADGKFIELDGLKLPQQVHRAWDFQVFEG